MRRIGWSALGALCGVLLVVSIGAGITLAQMAYRDGGLSFQVLVFLAVGYYAARFWWWLLRSIRLRLGTVPVVDQAGEPTDVDEVDPIGPWGVVGRALIGVMLVGFLGLSVWAGAVVGPTKDRAESARDEAVRLAQDRGLTASDVQAAITSAGFADGDHTGLLPLTEGTIASLAADGDRASILIRVDGSPPCAAVDITHGDIIRGRLTDRC